MLWLQFVFQDAVRHCPGLEGDQVLLARQGERRLEVLPSLPGQCHGGRNLFRLPTDLENHVVLQNLLGRSRRGSDALQCGDALPRGRLAIRDGGMRYAVSPVCIRCSLNGPRRDSLFNGVAKKPFQIGCTPLLVAESKRSPQVIPVSPQLAHEARNNGPRSLKVVVRLIKECGVEVSRNAVRETPVVDRSQ